MTHLIIFCLAFMQNMSFSLVSRARNRNNIKYLVACSILSNAVWFMTFRELILSDMNFILLIPYTLGTTAGSVFGVKTAMKIESLIGAKT